MAGRVECPELVGRDRELGVLAAAWSAARGGGSRLVLVRADAGYGKSRLLRAFEAEELAGCLVLPGSCVYAGGFGSPLLPFWSALAELVHAWGRERVAGLAVGAGALLDAVAGPEGGFGTARSLPPLSAGAQYDVLARVLDAASQEEPVALVLEDLHWAGQEAWALLDFVVRALRTGRLLVVATLRPDPPLPSPTWELVHELLSLPQVEVVDLPALSPSGVRRQLRGMLGRAPTEEMAERVVSRSRGVPFLVEELAAAESVGDTGVPGRVRDLLAHRTRELDADTRSVLEAAAVGVGPIDAGELAAVTGMSEDAVSTALRALVDPGLLVVDQMVGAATFRHELLREAAEAVLLPEQRRRLHQRHAELSDARAADGDVPSALAAAHHWGAAGNVAAAWRAAEVAVVAASRSGLRRQEWRLLEQQLDRYDQASAAGVPVPDRVSMLQRAGTAAGRCGEFDRAARLLEQAWRSLDPRTNPGRLLDVLDDMLEAVHGDVAVPAELEHAALAALAGLPATASPARLRGLHVIFGFQAERRDFDAAWATIREAVACAEQLGDKRQAAKLRLAAVIMLGIDNDDPPRALQYFADARAVALAEDDHELVLWIAMNEADFLYILGRHQEGLRRAREALALAEQLPAVAEIYEFVVGNLAEALLATGRWAEALDRLLAHTELDRPDIMRGVNYLQLAIFQLETGDLPAADLAYAEGCRRTEAGQDPQLPVLRGFVAAELALAHDQPAEAVRLAREAFRAHAHHVPTLRSYQLLHSAARAAAHLHGPDPDLTGWMRTGMDLLRDRPVVPPPFWPALLAAETAETAGTDPVLWGLALDCLEVGEAPVLVRLQARVGAARAAALAGHRDRAGKLLGAVVEEANQIGARRVREEAQALAVAHRLPVRGAGAAPAVPSTERGLGRLTARELQVLRLLARGHSNGRIAAELHISVKTASVHVSHILDKLGVANRGEAAAKAWESGLTLAAD